MGSPVDDALDRLEALAHGPHGSVVRYPEAVEDAATVRAELERLREERDAGEKRAADSHEVMVRVYERAEAAEVELARTREGLRELLDAINKQAPVMITEATLKARALLAASPPSVPTGEPDEGGEA